MTRRYFGTDGIRGRANIHPMTAKMAMKAAMAAALALGRRKEGPESGRLCAVIGKDTRISGYMLEQAMCAGFVSMGMDVILVGPMPTPAVAMLTRERGAALGVMISASHNPYEDNGIKLFGPDGYKLADDIEVSIETLMDQNLNDRLVDPKDLGKATRLDDAMVRYVGAMKDAYKGERLKGLKIVIDCANGAAYKVGPEVLIALGAQVKAIAAIPDGKNINAGCGATATTMLQEEVVKSGADIGIALDGDADRLIMVDETGAVIDGDQIMAALAVSMKEAGTLVKDTLVATVMSNLGLERFLQSRGISMLRTVVGDRYVMEAMKQGGYNLGGEQSGHVILSDFATTGDGLLAALQMLGILKASGEKASKALRLFSPLPQILRNVRFESGSKPLEIQEVKDAIAKAEETLANDGRLLVRPSGTEPLIRVMAEGDNLKTIEDVVGNICSVIEKEAGSA